MNVSITFTSRALHCAQEERLIITCCTSQIEMIFHTVKEEHAIECRIGMT